MANNPKAPSTTMTSLDIFIHYQSPPIPFNQQFLQQFPFYKTLSSKICWLLNAPLPLLQKPKLSIIFNPFSLNKGHYNSISTSTWAVNKATSKSIIERSCGHFNPFLTQQSVSTLLHPFEYPKRVVFENRVNRVASGVERVFLEELGRILPFGLAWCYSIGWCVCAYALGLLGYWVRVRKLLI